MLYSRSKQEVFHMRDRWFTYAARSVSRQTISDRAFLFSKPLHIKRRSISCKNSKLHSN